MSKYILPLENFVAVKRTILPHVWLGCQTKEHPMWLLRLGCKYLTFRPKGGITVKIFQYLPTFVILVALMILVHLLNKYSEVMTEILLNVKVADRQGPWIL